MVSPCIAQLFSIVDLDKAVYIVLLITLNEKKILASTKCAVDATCMK